MARFNLTGVIKDLEGKPRPANQFDKDMQLAQSKVVLDYAYQNFKEGQSTNTVEDLSQAFNHFHKVFNTEVK